MTELSHIRLTGRPLIISDVDDVILQFIAPFERFLEARGLKFLPRSFRLTGNIVGIEDGVPVEEAVVKQSLHDFFAEQHVWQQPFEHVLDTLPVLAQKVDIVFLTAMPPQFADARRAHLKKLGLPYPVVAAEKAKGPIAAAIRDTHVSPVVFVDDMAHNLSSVADHLPDCLLISLAPPSAVHALAPRPPEVARIVSHWLEAADLIGDHIRPPKVA